MLHFDLLLNSLPIMGYGMLGIFVVTGVIIGVVTLLNKITSDKKCRGIGGTERCPRFFYRILTACAIYERNMNIYNRSVVQKRKGKDQCCLQFYSLPLLTC